MSKADKIDMSLDDIIKTDKSVKKNIGKGGRSNNNQAKKQPAKKGSNVRQAAKKNSGRIITKKGNYQANGAFGKPASRSGLRPRVQPGKAKTTFKSAKAPQQTKARNQTKKTLGGAKKQSINQTLALKRLNKARATLQKAVKAVDDANKNLARTLPNQPKNKPPQKSRSNSISRVNNANRGQSIAQKRRNQAVQNQRNQNQRRGGGKIQKRNKNMNRGDVAIKINNRGPSGRGRGRVNVVRDTLKKEKPATSLDDRFSQLLKSAARSTNRGGRGGPKGGRGGRGGGNNRGNRGGQKRSASSNRRRF